MNKESWQGVFPALLTPFKSDDSIDFDLFRKNLEVQIEAGVTGAIVSGSLGEASTLTKAEKVELVKYAKSIVAQDFPIVVCIAEQSTAEAVSLAKEAEAAG